MTEIDTAPVPESAICSPQDFARMGVVNAACLFVDALKNYHGYPLPYPHGELDALETAVEHYASCRRAA